MLFSYFLFNFEMLKYLERFPDIQKRKNQKIIKLRFVEKIVNFKQF